MGGMFKNDGTINFPKSEHFILPRGKVKEEEEQIIIKEAFCKKGHSLMIDIKIHGHDGIHFIYTDTKGSQECDVVISAIVGDRTKKIIRGKPFEQGTQVKALCPECRKELAVLVNCECGAPIYLFYLDSSLDQYLGQAFCSRISCVKSSSLRFSKDLLMDYIQHLAY